MSATVGQHSSSWQNIKTRRCAVSRRHTETGAALVRFLPSAHDASLPGQHCSSRSPTEVVYCCGSWLHRHWISPLANAHPSHVSWTHASPPAQRPLPLTRTLTPLRHRATALRLHRTYRAAATAAHCAPSRTLPHASPGTLTTLQPAAQGVLLQV